MFKILISSIVLVFVSVYARADTITLTASNLLSASLVVPSNIVAQVIHSSATGASCGVYPISYKLNVTINGQTIVYSQGSQGNTVLPMLANPPIVVGPATITLINTTSSSCAQDATAICTIQTSPAISTSNFTPSSTVVIPNDNGGSVTIVLESSTDLVNWVAALPGTYGTSSSNRFFRVRATR
jgi:hypothetical protein